MRRTAPEWTRPGGDSEEPRRALARLAARPQCPAANLLLVGDGPQRRELAQLVNELQLSHSVHFLGAISDPLPYLQASDLFILPSISEGMSNISEGMSNGLLEAMACGIPSVVSAAGGNTDLVQNGQAGLIADATTPSDLASQLIRMLHDSLLRQRCGAHSRRIICEQYSIQSIVDRYETLYRQLAAHRHCG